MFLYLGILIDDKGGFFMQLGKKRVKIKLVTDIDDGFDKQQTAVKASGDIFQTKRQTVIRFTEQIEEQPDVTTMVTIKPARVTIKRSGGVEMNQQFRTDQVTETIYRHQFGSMRMETTTHDVDYKPLTDKNTAELKLNYTTILNGEEEREHKLSLTIEEDN